MLMIWYKRLIVGFSINEDDYNYVMDCINEANIVTKWNVPLSPKSIEVYGMFGDTIEYSCSVCGCGLRKNDRYKDLYCPQCGRKVDWRDKV